MVTKADGSLSVRNLSVIFGLVGMILAGGIYIGSMATEVRHHNEDLKKICNRLDSIDKKIDLIYQKKVLVQKFQPLVQGEN